MSTPSRRLKLIRVYGNKTKRTPTRKERLFLNPKKKLTKKERQFLNPTTYRVKLARKKKKRTRKKKNKRKRTKRKRTKRKRTKRGGFCITKECKRKKRIEKENKKFDKDIKQHKKETEQIKWNLVNELCTQTDKKEFEYCRNSILLPSDNRSLDKLLINTNNMIKSPMTHKPIKTPPGLKIR
jgi:hypothetical protein